MERRKSNGKVRQVFYKDFTTEARGIRAQKKKKRTERETLEEYCVSIEVLLISLTCRLNTHF